MMHPYVIDTSVIYNITGVFGRKTKLKTLSQMFLGEIIQDKGAEGHDPKEDAIAAMKLVLLKLEKGVDFGDATYNASTVVMMDKKHQTNQIMSTSIFKEIEDNEKTVCLISTPEIVENYRLLVLHSENDSNKIGSVTFSECKTNKEIIEMGSKSLAKQHNMTICHLDATTIKDEEKRLAKVKKWTKKIWSNTSTNGIFIAVWPGTPIKHAFIGISINKYKL
jgi:RNA exonuclease 1